MEYFEADMISRIVYLVVLLIFIPLILILRKKLNLDSRSSILSSIVILFLSIILPNFDIQLNDFGFEGKYENVIIINPYDFVSILTIIVVSQTIGILLMQVMNKRAGTFFMALIGGIASSTTLTQLFGLQSKRIKGDADDKTYASISVIANASSMIEKIFIIGSINFSAMLYLLPFLLSHMIVGVIIGGVQMSRSFKVAGNNNFNTSFFSFSPIIIFGVLNFVVSLFNQVIVLAFDSGGEVISTGIAYIAGLNIAIIQIVSRGFEENSLLIMINLILIAFFVNILTKIFSAATMGTTKYLMWTSFGLTATLLMSTLIQYFFYVLFF